MITFEEVSGLRIGLLKLARQIRKQNAAMPYSQTELNIIGHLDRLHTALPSQLSALEHISAQAVSQNLNNLAANGIVIRKTDETDKRKIKITLSNLGHEKLKALRQQRDEWFMHTIKARLSATEIEQLINSTRLFQKLTATI
ncbi:MAG: MarR family transcriptional regulator [Bacteroidota bacterium]